MSDMTTPTGPAADPATQQLRLALSKVVASWRGEPGALVYELVLVAATICRLEGLEHQSRIHTMQEVLKKALELQLKREAEQASQETNH